MRNHWMTILAIGLSMGACDEAVNVNCGEDGCQFTDEECHEDEIRCINENQGYLKCIDNQWNHFEPCEENKVCDDAVGKCVDNCESNAFECMDDSTTSYRICENKDWVFKTCKNGTICQNNQCIAPDDTEECQADAFECTGETTYRHCVNQQWETDTCDEDQICQDNHCIPKTEDICNDDPPECIEGSPKDYRVCIDNHWTEETCEGEQICQNGSCVSQPQDECDNALPECIEDSPKDYRVCIDNHWEQETCEGDLICQNGECVPDPTDDCKIGDFIECSEDHTQKIIVENCNPKTGKSVTCTDHTICDAEKKDCINREPQPDPCLYASVKNELNGIPECSDAKTFIISRSTDLSQLGNWHDNGNKSCLVFCNDIALDGLTDSIPLPPNTKVVGVNEAKLHAQELSKPLFIPPDYNKTEPIVSNTIQDLSISVDRFVVADAEAHAVLANRAESVKVEHVTLTAKLEHNEDHIIIRVGGLFGEVNGDTKLDHITLNNTQINIKTVRPNSGNNAQNNKLIGGMVGQSLSGKLTVTNPVINNLTINSGLSAHVGGVVGYSNSEFKLTVDDSNAPEYTINGLTITNAERNTGAIVGGSGGENAKAPLEISNVKAIINDISSFYTCTGGLIGYNRTGRIKLDQIWFKSKGTISSGRYSGGIIGYVWDGTKIELSNINAFVNNIIVNINDNFNDASYAGGILGSFKGLEEDSRITNVTLLAHTIKAANMYAGGFIGGMKEGKNKKMNFKFISNFVQEISANENSGGLIGFVEKGYTINIEKLQNVILSIKTFKDFNSIPKVYPGGVVGRLNEDNLIHQIKFNNIFSYSARYTNELYDPKNLNRTHYRTIIANPYCSNNDNLFKDSTYYRDLPETVSPCGMDYPDTTKVKEISPGNCEKNKPKDFKCTKVKVDEAQDAITIPLFDTSMLDGEKIKW